MNFISSKIPSEAVISDPKEQSAVAFGFCFGDNSLVLLKTYFSCVAG